MEPHKDDDELPPLTAEEQRELKKIEKTINQSRKLTPKIKKPLWNVQDKKRNYNAITGRLEEILDSYIVIGFDNNGNDYIALKMATPQDHLSLNALVERFVNGQYSAISAAQLENDFDDDDEL